MDVARNIQRLGLPLRSAGAQGSLFFDHTPLYVYLLSVYARPSDVGILIARLVTVFCGLGCVGLTYAIGCRMGGRVSGFVAALLVAISPFFALHTFYVRMEVFMVCAMLAGLLLLRSDEALRLPLVLAAGVMLAIAVLFKEVTLLFAVWCAVYVWYLLRRERRPILVALAMLLVPSGLGLAGWAAWAWKLSPAVFTSTMRRWSDAMAAANLLDPRARLSAGLWAQQLVTDLLGPALVVGLAISLCLSVARWIAAKPTRRLDPLQVLLWGYLLSALGISFLVRLKEPRHVIGILPVAALLIGSSIPWERIMAYARGGRSWPVKAALGVGIALFFLIASPLRIPSGPLAESGSWLDGPYAARLLGNDRFYNVLRLTGDYLREHTDPGEVITVAHQATVTGYYADRRYLMLYTMPKEAIERTLQRTTVLVWDDENFQVLSRPEVEALRQEVEKRFVIEQVVRDDVRAVTIYR